MTRFILVQAIATIVAGGVYEFTKNTALAGWLAGTVYWLFAAVRYI